MGCAAESHLGPLVDREKFDAAGGHWRGMGTCAACRSTVHQDAIRTTKKEAAPSACNAT